MLRGTRMIVITGKKLAISTAGVLMLTAVSIFFANIPAKKITTAFSEYEIIDSQLLPKEKRNTEKSGQILKNFFMLKDAEATPLPEVFEEEPEPDMLKSESVKVDKGMSVSNATEYSVNPAEAAKEPLSFALDDNGAQVLIMHTHTTESFAEETYVKGAPDRDLDENKNVSAVGEAMREVFEKNGIKTIHDRTVHDYPSYNGAYQSAAATINKNIRENPGIKIVLDVHRDGITREDGTKVKLVTEMDGEKCAQVMLVVGTDVNLEHKNWRENFKFASKIQDLAIETFPSLMRPIDLRQERFNEQLSPGSLIIEVGANGNTIEEAKRGGEKIAEVICEVLKNNGPKTDR